MDWKLALREVLTSSMVHEVLNWVHNKQGKSEDAPNVLKDEATTYEKAKLFTFVQKMEDAEARGKLLKRLNELARESKLKDKYFDTLVRIVRAAEDDNGKKEILEALANMSDEEFNGALSLIGGNQLGWTAGFKEFLSSSSESFTASENEFGKHVRTVIGEKGYKVQETGMGLPSLLKLFLDIWDITSMNFVDVVKRFAFVRSDGKSVARVYLETIGRLALVWISMPAILLLVALIDHFWLVDWIVIIGRYGWFACTVALAVALAPVGILITVMLDKPESSVKSYTNLVLGIFLAQLAFALFLIWVPMKNNPNAVPSLVISGCMLGLMSAMGTKTLITSKGLMRFIATTAFLIAFVSFFIPKSVAFVGGRFGGVDDFFVDSMENIFRKPNYITFAQYETIKSIKLNSTQWTPFIVIPKESESHSFSVTDSVRFVFDNGDSYIVTPADMPSAFLNSHPGTFKMRGMGIVTITIIHKLSNVQETVAKQPTEQKVITFGPDGKITIMADYTWSPWILVPPCSRYRIDNSGHIKVGFKDCAETYDLYPDRNTPLGTHAGPIRVKGVGTVTITIIHKLSSVPETITKQPTESTSITFAPGETVKFLQLDSEQWTPFVITPSESTYNINITDSTEIIFADKTRLTATPNMPDTSIGIHRGIFKFRGRGTVTITIKFS